MIKIRLFTFVSMLLLSLCAEAAANYTVKQAGGGNFTTIQACVSPMAPGDTCTIYAGDYSNEGVINVSSGSAGAFKTLQVNGNDLVTAVGFNIGSYVKIIGGAALRPTTTGLHIQNPNSPHSGPCVQIDV